MAKTTSKVVGNSKIRFVMLEADLADGDLTHITSAIMQAMKQGQPAVRHIAMQTSSGAQQQPHASNGPVPETDELDGNVLAEDNGNGGEPVASTKVRGSRRLSTPKVLSDVDLNSGDVPFQKFASEKGPKATLSRYLVVAYWFKTYRQVYGVNMNHVFTCYKKMGWGTDIKDFSQALRDNAKQGRGEMQKGTFVINHIGEDIVEKMSPE